MYLSPSLVHSIPHFPNTGLETSWHTPSSNILISSSNKKVPDTLTLPEQKIMLDVSVNIFDHSQPCEFLVQTTMPWVLSSRHTQLGLQARSLILTILFWGHFESLTSSWSNLLCVIIFLYCISLLNVFTTVDAQASIPRRGLIYAEFTGSASANCSSV